MKAALAIAGILCMVPAPAQAAINEVQIDWMIAADDWKTVSSEVRDREVRYRFRVLPSRLFVAQEDVLSAQGAKLLPAGAQLYGMTGRNLAMCSQVAAEPPFAGAGNRVCLRDDNGDGTLDSYWLRVAAKQLFGKDFWFAMNNDLPANRSALARTNVVRMSSANAAMTVELSLIIRLNGDGGGSSSIFVRNGGVFTGRCQPERPSRRVDGSTRSICLIPDLIARGINVDAPRRRDRRLEVTLPNRDVRVRFLMSPALILGRNMESIYFE